MVVDRDREDALRTVLPYDVVVEDLADLRRRRDAVSGLHESGLALLADDVVAELDALIADEDGRSSDQLPDLMLRLAAEGAVEGALAVAAR